MVEQQELTFKDILDKCLSYDIVLTFNCSPYCRELQVKLVKSDHQGRYGFAPSNIQCYTMNYPQIVYDNLANQKILHKLDEAIMYINEQYKETEKLMNEGFNFLRELISNDVVKQVEYPEYNNEFYFEVGLQGYLIQDVEWLWIKDKDFMKAIITG